MHCRFCFLFCCFLIFGCGNPKPYDIRAVVTLDGEPFVEAEVVLLPVRENNASAIGITDREGKVSFTTGEINGVLPGSYIMLISKIVEDKTLTNNEIRALAEVGIRYGPRMIELVPEKYTRRETSDLRVKIGYWYSKELSIDLQSEKPLLGATSGYSKAVR